MEFLPGGELSNVIEQKFLTEDQARGYFLQILLGLEYIHKKGYAHRDIKPENLMLDQEGKIKIGDFGLSGLLKPGEFLKTQCGSPNYAAPELISGDKYCGNEVDIWSLGVVLYTLLARVLPFDELSMPALFAKIKSGQFKIQHHFSDSLRDLILRMLTVNPIERITIQQIHCHPWLRQFPLYDFSLLSTKRNIKMYENEEIHRKALKSTSEYPNFNYLQIEIIENIIKKNAKSNNYTKEGDNISATYNILLDLEIKIQKSKIKMPQTSEKSISKYSILQSLSGRTTAGSSYIETDDKSLPSNWVYGFRSNIKYDNLLVKLFESLKGIGFCWKIKSKRVSIKGKKVKLLMICYKFEESLVIDCTLKKGSTMIFFEVIQMIYSIIYKYAHIW